MSKGVLIAGSCLFLTTAVQGGKGTAPPRPEQARRAAGLSASPRLEADQKAIRELIDRGDYSAAEESAQFALADAEGILGPESIEASSLIDLLVEAMLERGKQSDPETVRLARRAVAIKESELGPGHLEVATSLMLLGEVHRRRGDRDGAMDLFARARAIREAQLPGDHPDIADSLHHLGLTMAANGDYVGSRRLFEQALEIYQGNPGPRSRESGQVLTDLATVLYIQGDYSEARNTFERALDIRRSVLGPSHPHVAGTLNNYGSLLDSMGELEEAKEIFEQAIAIQEAAHRDDHPRLANTIQNLGSVLQKMGDLEGAKRSFVRAIEIHESVLGPDHPRVAAGRDSFGFFLLEKGDYAAAQTQFERALEIRRRALGPQHPDVAVILNNLARVLAARGMIDRAIETALEAEAISGDHLQLTILALSEREALNYASVRSTGLDLVLSLSGTTLDDSTRRDIWDAVIRSRAIVLDEMANRYRSIGSIDDPGVRNLAAHLRVARSELADLIVGGPRPEQNGSYPELVAEARRKRERAERALADKSLSFRDLLAQSRARLQDIEGEIPATSALIAYYAYMQPGTGGGEQESTRRYVAFVLRAGESSPAIIHLGDAAVIDGAISRWIEWVSRAPGWIGSEVEAAESAARRAGESVRAAIWDPLIPALGDVERVFIVPDDALHLVSLQALPTGDRRYLLQSGPVIHHLAAERDIMRREMRTAANHGLFILGDPAFESTPVAVRAAPPEGERESIPGSLRGPGSGTTRSGCSYFAGVRFPRLPGTAREVEQIADLWRREGNSDETAVLSLSGNDATESTFKSKASDYGIVHLATHGFFLDGRCPSVDPNGRGFAGLQPDDDEVENPLLLSGLVFAGANRRDEADQFEEDGILTAEEIAATDLSGVQWAVLSACDTGMGEIMSGEGVFGLRRAFQVAGVTTLIMSLWEVDDDATAEWMLELYRGRLHGLDTADAVRGAGLAMLNGRRNSGQSTHPFFWAAFVAAGGWR